MCFSHVLSDLDYPNVYPSKVWHQRTVSHFSPKGCAHPENVRFSCQWASCQAHLVDYQDVNTRSHCTDACDSCDPEFSKRDKVWVQDGNFNKIEILKICWNYSAVHSLLHVRSHTDPHPHTWSLICKYTLKPVEANMVRKLPWRSWRRPHCSEDRPGTEGEGGNGAWYGDFSSRCDVFLWQLRTSKFRHLPFLLSAS